MAAPGSKDGRDAKTAGFRSYLQSCISCVISKPQDSTTLHRDGMSTTRASSGYPVNFNRTYSKSRIRVSRLAKTLMI